MSGIAKENSKMPAEWEPHEATWLSWPKNKDTFPGKILPSVELIYIKIIESLHRKEKINLLVDDKSAEYYVLKRLEEYGVSRNVFFYRIPTADVWIRDYGPIFIRQDKKIKITKWNFNAWGGKYADLAKDNEVFDVLAPKLSFDPIRPGIVLEGGSIDVNGRGTLLTTEQCLLNKNRNPHLTRSQIEEKLCHYLGAGNIIWLKEGVAGDDTDGHIDDIARFVDPDTIVCALEENRSDDNYQKLKNNFEILKTAINEDGDKFNVVPLPMPGMVKCTYGRLPASYANFYIGNAAVLLPVFGHRNDDKARSILEEYLPKRKVVPINCEPLVWGLGTIHCATQQQPGDCEVVVKN